MEIYADLDVPETKELWGKRGLRSCSVFDTGYKSFNGMVRK